MIIHTVSAGQTFYSIAATYGISVPKLLCDNGIKDPDSPVVGQALLSRRPKEQYTVKAGDTPLAIATAAGIALQTLYRNNPCLSDGPLFPGHQLVLS
ncbi:MAG: LysM peptidoglycan-binding domain-containing protein [Clostridia bacterium]|nr:LysM peptidoglycan-binding domain-containing protein [Clostridia bacterium]